MSPEEYLAFLEASNQYMDGITSIKDGLQNRGWSEPQASTAAREMFGMILGASMAAQAGVRK